MFAKKTVYLYRSTRPQRVTPASMNGLINSIIIGVLFFAGQNLILGRRGHTCATPMEIYSPSVTS